MKSVRARKHKKSKYKANSLPTDWKKWKADYKKQQQKESYERSLINKMQIETQENPSKSNVEETKETHSKNIRKFTLSIAVPASILKNAQTRELRTYLVGQIARSATIFNVDEIVVFDDRGTESKEDNNEPDFVSRCSSMARILQYLECPQYLRKRFFPLHPELKFAGILNPLDTPHHLRIEENFRFREGVVLEKQKAGKGSYVDVGLEKAVLIDRILRPGLRVTVDLLPANGKEHKYRKGKVVDPSRLKTEHGIYWGYNVRMAECISAIFKRCPYEGGYDMTIGTSDKGTPINKIEISRYKHVIVVFGGLKGLEESLSCDDQVKQKDPNAFFNLYVNAVVNQGTRTIRTEEAILITLAALQPKLMPS